MEAFYTIYLSQFPMKLKKCIDLLIFCLREIHNVLQLGFHVRISIKLISPSP